MEKLLSEVNHIISHEYTAHCTHDVLQTVICINTVTVALVFFNGIIKMGALTVWTVNITDTVHSYKIEMPFKELKIQNHLNVAIL